MKRLYYFFREFKVDILTSIVAVVAIILVWKYTPSDGLKNVISILAAMFSLLIIIYSRSKDKDFIFLSLNRRKDKEKWIGYGDFQFDRTKNSYGITNADPGYIHQDTLAWSDYKITFDFKIIHRILGVLCRAVNLANYIMMQITTSGIRPHIRINGGWKIWEANDVSLNFSEPLSLDIWYKCEIKCNKGTISIILFSSREKIFDRSWEIPKGSILFEYKVRENDPATCIPFPVILDYGAVGFRNSGEEKALVRNFLVEKL